MLWIVLVVAVGVVGLGVLVWYCVRLTRKVAELADEVAVLAEQAEQLFGLLEQVEVRDADSALSAFAPGVRQRTGRRMTGSAALAGREKRASCSDSASPSC